jgi:hypothetical protein
MHPQYSSRRSLVDIKRTITALRRNRLALETFSSRIHGAFESDLLKIRALITTESRLFAYDIRSLVTL